MATEKPAASKKNEASSVDEKKKSSTSQGVAAKKTADSKAKVKGSAAKPTPATKKKPVVSKKSTATKATSKPPKDKPTPEDKPRKKIATSSIEENVNTGSGITKEYGRYALASSVDIEIPEGYKPSDKEEYMHPLHLAYFRKMLQDWRDQLVEESRQTMDNLRGEVRDVGDDAERATRETENSFELRTRDRYRKLLSKIDKSLRLIEQGEYGFCEETDEEIGLARLEVRPIATLSLDAQERREHLEKQMRD